MPEPEQDELLVDLPSEGGDVSVEIDPLVSELVPLISYAYGRIATPRIRHMATVGGGLVHGDPSQDPPPSLIALGARVILSSASDQRELLLEDFYLDYYETDVRGM